MGRLSGVAVLVLVACGIHTVLGEWDYIVVGAGASGCAIAPTLAEDGRRVLVLEAGGYTAWDFGGEDQSAGFGELKSSTVFDVPGEAARLRGKEGNWWHNLPWGFAGRGVGGSGMMTEGLAMIPSPTDFRYWPAGWKNFEMMPWYRKVLSELSVTTTSSTDGILHAQGAGQYFDRLATNSLGLKKVPLNSKPGARANTFSVPEVTAKGGKRVDACQSILLPALKKMDNLSLRVNSEVKWITFKQKGLARGVILASDGTEILLNSNGKIVLAAGSLQTPRLLMFSGVGPTAEVQRLSDAGFVLDHKSYWVENNHVGKNMFDHTYSQMVVKVPKAADFSFRYSLDQADPIAASMYLEGGKGPYAQFGTVRLAFLAMPGHSVPDVELLVLPSGVEGSLQRDCNTCFRILVMPLRPKSRADYQIKTPDMNCDCGRRTCLTGDICKPALYLADDDDRKVVQWAFEHVAQAVKAEGYEVLTPTRNDRVGISYFLQDSQEAKYPASHWAGSCQMGICTDMNLKVKGTANVFVADASVFPAPVGAHTAATTIAVAHRAGIIIKHTDALSSTDSDP